MRGTAPALRATALLSSVMLAAACSPKNPPAAAEPTPPPIDENGWPGTLAEYEGYEGTGAQVGDFLPGFALPDQENRLTRFEQFLGHVLLVDASTRWCGPCNKAAQTSMDLLDRMQDAGPSYIITLMVQDLSGLPATVEDAAEWAEMYGATYPVVVDDAEQTRAAWGVQSFPVFFWVAPTGEIYHRSDVHLGDDEAFALVEQGLEEWADELRPWP